MKTIGASLKTEIQSGAPVIATCWKIERTDGTIMGFTDWADAFTYDGLKYETSGGYQRTAIDQREGLAVDNMDVVGLIDSAYITEPDLLAGFYRGAKVWIFMISPPNLSWGIMKLDYGVLGEIHVGEIHFVAEFRSLVTKLSQEFGDKFSRYCRHKLGSSKLVGGVETKCGVQLAPDAWVVSTAYDIGDVVRSTEVPGYQWECTAAGTSVDNSEIDVAGLVVETSPLAFWMLNDFVADASWSSVKALFHMDGANGSTTFTEETGKTATVVGNTQIKTDNQVFGSAGYFDGVGDYVHLPNSTDWQWSGGTFTFEAFVYIEAWPAASQWAAIAAWHTGTTGWRLLYDDDERLHLATDNGAAGGFVTANGTLSLNTWHHVAFCIDGTGKVQAFIDGAHLIVDGSVTTCTSPAATTFKIGSNDGSAWFHKGYIDELRVTKGVARYSAAFDVQRAPFQTNTPRVFDYSPNQYHGLAVNTPTFESAGITDRADITSVDFQSADTDSVNVNDADFDNLFDAGGSVMGWALCDTGSTGNNTIIGKDGGTSGAADNYGGWNIFVRADTKKLSFYIRLSDGVTLISNGVWDTPADSIVLGTAFHWAITMTAVDGTSVPKMYINGVEQTLTVVAAPTAAHTPKSDSGSVMYIGQRDTAQGSTAIPFDGKIQSITVYDSVKTEADIGRDMRFYSGQTEPPWDTTFGSIIGEGDFLKWRASIGLTFSGTVGTVTSDYKFTDTGLNKADAWFKYGVVTWVTGDNAGRSQDVKDSTSAGVITLRQETALPITVGDTFTISVGCNHILKMPGDAAGSPYTGDCRIKFANVRNYGGEPELPNLDRVSTPAGSA